MTGRESLFPFTETTAQPNRVTFTFRCRVCQNEMYDGVCGAHEHEGVQVDYTPRDA